VIRILHYDAEKHFHTEKGLADIPALLQDQTGVLWVDFQGTPPEEDAPILLETFHFHPLAVDDALQESHVPKVDDWGSYVYVVLHSVLCSDVEHECELETRELDIFLGRNYLVTHHDEPVAAVERVWNLIQRDERHLNHGADHLLYRLCDEVVASYMPVVEALDDAIDHVEDEVFGRPGSHTLAHIFSLKRAAVTLRRIVSPQREVLNKLARDDYAAVDSRARIYFRDVYDHLVRLHDISDSLRDLIGGVLDTYLSVINNRMNDIMKTLTVITTLFMPISFLTGFFGMNYFQPVADALIPWTGLPAFILAMAVFIATPIVMLAWMRRQGWM
jgi:magnesium transporter